MAGPHSDRGQVVTHLLLTILPIFIIILMRDTIPNDPKSRHLLMAEILRGIPWHLWGHRRVHSQEFPMQEEEIQIN
jgi:hypothetical protein